MKRIVIVLFFVLMVGILLAACTAEETEQVLPTETPLPSLPTPTESTVLDDLTAIEMALAEYMGVGDVQVGEAEITALYATGGVENGYFLAARSGDDWVIVYAGQAVPPCGEIEQYDFPVEMVPECLYDGKVVLDRTSDQPPENEPLDDPERAILEALAAYLGQDVDNMDAAVTEIEGTIAKGTPLWIFLIPTWAALFLIFSLFLAKTQFIFFCLGLGLFVLSLPLVLFFRDPLRNPGESIVSPADGRVMFVDENKEAGQYHIAIFMSPLNVHVNRSPMDCVV